MTNSQGEGNRLAWQHDTYTAWTHRYGTPAEAAERIRRNPMKVLHPLQSHFNDVKGRRVGNLMGSAGIKAVALAVLGGKITVYDYSPANARYALELAREALVELRYLTCDVLAIPPEEPMGCHDIVFAEMGILHYFTDLSPFMAVAAQLLAPAGLLVLRDFHPVSTKLISSRGSTANIRKHKVTGDYFDTSLQSHPAPFVRHLPGGEQGEAPTVLWRRWTLGEVITAIASAGLCITELTEEPNLSSEVFDRGIPKTYTVAAVKRRTE